MSVVDGNIVDIISILVPAPNCNLAPVVLIEIDAVEDMFAVYTVPILAVADLTSLHRFPDIPNDIALSESGCIFFVTVIIFPLAGDNVIPPASLCNLIASSPPPMDGRYAP